jgi:hypothetical protein
MKTIILILLIFAGCRSTLSSHDKHDEFDKIFQLRKTNDPKDLFSMLGKPDNIETSGESSDQYFFYKKEGQMPINVFVNKKNLKISTIVLAYPVQFDAYAYLKKRFKAYRWIETPKKSKSVDVMEELYKVEIPELGISFEYDNQDPLRRPMWIFFNP